MIKRTRSHAYLVYPTHCELCCVAVIHMIPSKNAQILVKCTHERAYGYLEHTPRSENFI